MGKQSCLTLSLGLIAALWGLTALAAPARAGEYQFTGADGTGTVTRTSVTGSQQVTPLPAQVAPTSGEDHWPLYPATLPGSGSLVLDATEVLHFSWVPATPDDPPRPETGWVVDLCSTISFTPTGGAQYMTATGTALHRATGPQGTAEFSAAYGSTPNSPPWIAPTISQEGDLGERPDFLELTVSGGMSVDVTITYHAEVSAAGPVNVNVAFERRPPPKKKVHTCNIVLPLDGAEVVVPVEIVVAVKCVSNFQHRPGAMVEESDSGPAHPSPTGFMIEVRVFDPSLNQTKYFRYDVPADCGPPKGKIAGITFRRLGPGTASLRALFGVSPDGKNWRLPQNAISPERPTITFIRGT